MEVPDPGLGRYGVQGCGAGYDGIWGHGESRSFLDAEVACSSWDSERLPPAITAIGVKTVSSMLKIC
jgi:hypothetical protein